MANINLVFLPGTLLRSGKSLLLLFYKSFLYYIVNNILTNEWKGTMPMPWH